MVDRVPDLCVFILILIFIITKVKAVIAPSVGDENVLRKTLLPRCIQRAVKLV